MIRFYWSFLVSGVIIGLIISGFLGFLVGYHIHKERTHSTIITVVTIINRVTEIAFITKTEFVTITVAMETVKISESEGECISLRPMKEVFMSSEPVVFRLINNCNQSLILSNPAPWKILDSNRKEVFTPITLQIINEVTPGDYREWAWDQRDKDGRLVQQGLYYIVLETINMGSIKTQIRIISKEDSNF